MGPLLSALVVLLCAWAAVLVGLLVVGSVLSHLTMASAARPPAEQSGSPTGMDAVLRLVYSAVIAGAGLFFYLSIPLVLLVLAVTVCGLILLFFEIGRIPIKLVLILLVGGLVSAWSIVRSLFVSLQEGAEPGERLDLASNPRMRQVLDDVAAKVGTRPVDTVYLVPGTALAVFERGGVLQRMTSGAERCLVLGVATLEGFELRPFRAVLAHEYGHFSNRDTAGGALGLRVRASLITMSQRMVEGGVASWFNPAWWFVAGYIRVFLRISQGATRLQEVLADRFSAYLYGAEAFEKGLVHVIRRSVDFDSHVNRTLRECVPAQRGLANLYAFTPTESHDPQQLDAAVTEALDRAPSPYDSHPRPKDRFTWTRALVATPLPVQPDDADPVWSLFSDREAVETRMTHEVRGILAMQGIVLRG